MNVDFGKVLTDFKGNPLSEQGGPNLKLGMAVELAMVALTPQAQRESGEEKYRNWKIASEAGRCVISSVSPEEVALMKTKIGEFFGAQVVGPAYELLNG